MRCSLLALGCVALGCLVLAPPCPAQRLVWKRIGGGVSPSARDFPAAAYDSRRQHMVMFGGRVGAGETWEYDGKWTRSYPTNSPPPRLFHAMTYDSARHRVVLFGGRTSGGTTALADTWEYDGNTWTQIVTAISPPAREHHALAFDSARNVVLCFGGNGGGYLADLWEYDGDNWQQATPPTSPPARRSCTLVYDRSRARAVLFGGMKSRFEWLGDTWEWTPAGKWVQINPPVSPGSRAYHGMVYDSARRRTVLFGGAPPVGPQADTWEFDGRSWTELNPSSSPPERVAAAMVYDTARQRVVLFGGGDWNLYPVNDTWEGVDMPTLTASPATVSIATGGTQAFALDAGNHHAGKLYWILGSVSGTSPGVSVGPVNIPLNPDVYTEITIAAANSTVLTNTMGTLDGSGWGSASFNMPKTVSAAIGLKLYHAYLVYDPSYYFHMASAPVELTLVQ